MATKNKSLRYTAFVGGAILLFQALPFLSTDSERPVAVVSDAIVKENRDVFRTKILFAKDDPKTLTAAALEILEEE